MVVLAFCPRFCCLALLLLHRAETTLGAGNALCTTAIYIYITQAIQSYVDEIWQTSCLPDGLYYLTKKISFLLHSILVHHLSNKGHGRIVLGFLLLMWSLVEIGEEILNF